MSAPDVPPASTNHRNITPSSSRHDLRSSLSAIFLHQTPPNLANETTRLLPDSGGGSSSATSVRIWTTDIDATQIGGEGPKDLKTTGHRLGAPNGAEPRE